MKKRVLLLLTLVPIAVGYLVNHTLAIPGLGSLLFRVLPLLTLVFWFYLGSRYAETNWRPVQAILIGSATGILSLLLYLWQFLWETDETRNVALAVLSQMYSAATPAYLFGRIAILFESQPNYVGQATMTALQVIAVVLMLAVFTCGYLWGRRRK